MIQECQICKGTKHIYYRDDSGLHVRRCECMLKEELAEKLARQDLSINYIEEYIEHGKIVDKGTWQQNLVKRIYQAVYENKPLKHNLYILTDRGINKINELYCLLALTIKNFRIRDVSEFIDDSFTNKKQSLPDVLVLTAKFFTSKNLAVKFIKELTLLSKQQGKVILLETQNKITLKDLEVNYTAEDAYFPPLERNNNATTR